MNKFLQTTLVSAILSTGGMASDFVASFTDVMIENEINLYTEFVNNASVALDFTPGGHGHIADDAFITNKGSIKLGQAEDTAPEDLITINVTKDITPEAPIEGGESSTTTYYQYRYISTDDSVKYVWSLKDNATKDDSGLISDIADTSATAAISDYQSGWGLVQGISGGTITGGRINQWKELDPPIIDINTDARYEVNAGYSLNQDDRTLNLETADPEKVFMDGYAGDKRKILGKDNSGGLFIPDIFNPEVLSKVTKNTKTLGDVSKNGLDPQKLSSQTEVKDYLDEWHITMHKGTEDIAYEETETNSIIEVLARTTSDQAVAIPDELAKGTGEIMITLPVWSRYQAAPEYLSGTNVTIAGNLHNIGYENETLTFRIPEYETEQQSVTEIYLRGNNQHLKGTVNFCSDSKLISKLCFEGENSIPGGVTNCNISDRCIQMGEHDDTNTYLNSVILPEGATLNILSNSNYIEGKLVVKGVLNIGVPKTTE